VNIHLKPPTKVNVTKIMLTVIAFSKRINHVTWLKGKTDISGTMPVHHLMMLDRDGPSKVSNFSQLTLYYSNDGGRNGT
jgi:hypothetical protein